MTSDHAQYLTDLFAEFEIFEDYSHLISKSHSGLLFPPGWTDYVIMVFKELDFWSKSHGSPIIVQRIAMVKNRLEVNYEGGDDELYYVHVDRICIKTVSRCEWCGEPISRRTSHNLIGPRCDKHFNLTIPQLRPVDQELIKSEYKRLSSKFVLDDIEKAAA